MKKKTKNKEILKVVAASTLALGLSCTAFIGVNNLAFAQAISGSTPLPEPIVPASDTNISQIQEQDLVLQDDVFVPPTVTLITSVYQQIPAHAMPKEEASQIGAQYIWDVFGSSIDGMYVYMVYQMLPGYTRPFWLGIVYPTAPTHLELNFADFEGDSNAWLDAHVFSSYSFRLDALTGMRVGVSYSAPSDREASIIAFREQGVDRQSMIRTIDPSSPEMLFRTKWFEMSAEEQLKSSDITSERFEYYMQMALDRAKRHFNITTVQDIKLGSNFQVPIQIQTLERLEFDSTGGFTAIIGTLIFTATDNTGREAVLRIPTANSSWRFTSVETMYNDFIPGFSYDRPGIG